MPSPAPDRTAAPRHRINPATCTHEELIEHLAVDPSTGLSPKEAERRRLRSLATPLFHAPEPRLSVSFGHAFREPVLWMLLCVSLISLFFDRFFLGLVCLLLAGGHAVLCAFLRHRASRIDTAMQAYDAPLARVMRGGRVRRISADGVVRGDILLLYPGDILPADCRLLRTEHFTVSERELDATLKDRPRIRLDKDADALPDTGGSFRLSPPNMAFAGGVVEAGFALAVVVAVGSDTHLGGLVGTVHPAHTSRRPDIFKMGVRALSLYNLALVVLVIPLVAIGIFTLGDSYEFLDIFLSAIALSSVGLVEHLLIKGTYVAAHIRRDAATDRDRMATADIKTSAVAEKLIGMTDLVLVGTAALHDGDAHPVTLRIGETVYHCDQPEADDDARRVAELLFVYGEGLASLPTVRQTGLSTDIAALIPSVIEWAEPDTEALLLKIHDARPDGDGVSAVFPSAVGNLRTRIRLLSSPDEFPPISDTMRERLTREWHMAVSSGYRTVFVITESGEGSHREGSVRALLTYAPRICPKMVGDIKSMESAGIRVSAFLRDSTHENDRILSAVGLTETVPVYDLRSVEEPRPAVELLRDGVRAFESCSEAYIRNCITDLQNEGRTVAVLSVEEGDLSLMDAADIAITCSPSLFASAEIGAAHIHDASPEASTVTGADGHAYATMASDLCRRRADVLVRRTNATGGGVCGVRRALLAADRFKDTLDATVAYLLLSQTVRLVLTLLSVCYGTVALSAPALLFSGLVADTLVVLLSSRLSVGVSPAPRHAVSDGLTAPWRTHRRRLIMAAIMAFVPSTTLLIAHFLGTELGKTAQSYLLLCLVGLQFAIFAASPAISTARGRRTDSTRFFIGMALALCYVGALAAALGAGLQLLWALLFPLVPGLVYFAINRLADRLLCVDALS